MNNNSDLKYFDHSRSYFRFILLKKLEEKKGFDLPIQSRDDELLKALSSVHIQNLIEEGLAKKENEEGAPKRIVITEKGKSQLQKHFIDYQLDLLTLERNLGDFYIKKVRKLKEENINAVALYGASDTAQSFLQFLIRGGITVACIFDDDEGKQSEKFLGYPVISHDEASAYTFDAIVITTVEFQDLIKAQISQSLGMTYKVLSLFD